MNCYRYTTTSFRFTIAAPMRDEAAALALSSCGTGVLTEWLTPDVWTGRVVDAAPSAAVVDCVPRFVVERGSTLDDVRELDLDHVPARLEAGEVDTLRKDSPIHATWLDALTAVHEGGAALRRYVVDVATCRDAVRWPTLARALAGAYGLGPVPNEYAAILPALVAADVEPAHGGLVPANWFDMCPFELLDVVEQWPENSLSRQMFGLVCRRYDVEASRRAAVLFLHTLGWFGDAQRVASA
jgi:hypothetical protein